LFGILNVMLLRPKPVARPHELWAVESADATGRPVGANLCRPYYEAIRRQQRVFKEFIGYASVRPKLRLEEGVERIRAELTSGNYFSFLGVVPVLGRGFLPEEDTEVGAHTVAVISYAFWQNHFGGTRDVLGKTLTLNDTLVEIVGVAPSGFTGLDFRRPSLWMPASMELMLGELTIYDLVGRLAEPKLAAAAADLLTPIAAEVTKELSTFEDPRWSRYGVSPNFSRIRLDPIGRGLLGTSYQKSRIVGFLKFAGVASVLLLLIACANVASLFLARALQRRKETATRIALGATRTALMHQVVCEGVLVAAMGTAGALLAFSWVGHAIMRFAGWWSGPPLRLVPDVRVLLFAAGGALLVGVGFSLLPALQATRFAPFTALKDSQGTSRQQLWLRHGLVVAQVVGSFILLCGATLCLRSMSTQLAVDLGYRSDRLAIAPLDLERIGFTEGTFEPQLAQIVRRVGLVPGVEQVGVSRIQPLGGQMAIGDTLSFPPEGYDSSDDHPISIRFYRGIGPGMFSIMGIPVLRGREFRQEDIESRRMVLMVNESFVQTFWPDQDALGKHIRDWEVVGVVKDACLDRHDERLGPTIFRCAKKKELLHPALLIRTSGDARRVVASVRTELGRSLAVGATRGDVIRLVILKGLRLGLIAVAIGVPLALAAAGFLRHQIAGISPFDPVSFLAVVACVLATLIAACWLPARRAARIDPMAALRCE
jgi:predicted permease